MTKGYLQIVEGEWIEPVHDGFIDQCCDCHMVHVFKFAVIDRKTRERVSGVQVQFKLTVDGRRTAASRRKLKFSKDED
jgi:hypothetical protein